MNDKHSKRNRLNRLKEAKVEHSREEKRRVYKERKLGRHHNRLFGFKPEDPALVEKGKWLEAFMKQYDPDFIAICRRDKNFFPILSEDFNETRDQVAHIAMEHTNVRICVVNPEPIIEIKSLLEVLLKRNNRLYVFEDDTLSRLLLNVISSFSEILESQTPNDGLYNVELAAEKRKEKALIRAMELKETIEDIENKGSNTLKSIAEELTRLEIPTPYGKTVWQPMTVKRVKDRIQKIETPPKS